uniref:Uncharacterized protein n=1 Tax=Oryza barthii TaxID=65489 RepID=A0A0D3ERY2_9ORYZ
MERLRQRQSHIEMAASGITAQLSTGLAIFSAGAARDKGKELAVIDYILPELDCSLSSKQYYKVFVALGMSFCLLSLFIISRSVFVDAGVAAIDIETKKRKEEMKAREAKSRAAAEHGDLALITVEGPKTTTSEKIV